MLLNKRFPVFGAFPKFDLGTLFDYLIHIGVPSENVDL